MKHVALIATLLAGTAATPQWLTLPPTPTLPPATRSGYVPVNGVSIWYATFGSGAPVVLLHGGLGNANYWGLQIRALQSHYRVIVLDSRCHGRSTCSPQQIGYDVMASDVVGVLDSLHVRKAAIVGWSDGAIIGLDLAIHHPARVARLFAFAANSDPSAVMDLSTSPVFTDFERRAGREYAQLSPTPQNYATFLKNINHMWDTQPHFTAAQLGGITALTWVADADHEEAIKRENTDYMAAQIPGAGEIILPRVSHFAFLQDAATFDAAVLRFLAQP
jgi:pimeloyl-ACP methyl ester carboxylesterase